MSDKRYADLEEFLQNLNLAPVRQEQDDVIAAFQDRVVVRNNDLVIANQRDNSSALRQFDIFYRTANNLRGLFFAVSDCLNCLGGAASERVHFDNVAATHMGK